MAKENRDWGYDRIAGRWPIWATRSGDQTVGNVLQRHALAPAPERKRTTTWAAFIRIHLALLPGPTLHRGGADAARAGDLLRVVFIHLESRRWTSPGSRFTRTSCGCRQIARNVTMEGCGALRDCRYLLHDRDTKYTQSFRRSR